MTDGKRKSGLKRWIPIVKIGIAAALIGFLLWLVPIRDHLVLDPSAEDPGPTATEVGTILDWEESQARFEAGEGREFVVTFNGPKSDEVIEIRFPTGETRDYRAAAPETRPRLDKGLITTLKGASLPHLGLALFLLFTGAMVAVYRWYLLLMAAELTTSFPRAFSLTFIGTFFNNVMPGLTGGDLVKAFYIAREHRSRKTEAIITVLVDRVLGITGLAMVAGIVIPTQLDQYIEVAPWIYALLLAVLVFGCVFFSRRIRRTFGIDTLLGKLPFQELVSKIDRAVFLYRFRRRILLITLLLSMLVHLIIITGIGTIGVGIGFDVDFLSYFAVVPIGLIVMALPIAPSGWGAGEAAFIYFWRTQGVPAASALSLALLFRMGQLIISMIGGVCLARLKDRVSTEEVERFAESDDGNGPEGDEAADGAESARKAGGGET